MTVHIHDFVAPATQENSGFPFAYTQQSVSAGLRKLADQVESGAVLVNKVELSATATVDDYTETALRVCFVEKGTVAS